MIGRLLGLAVLWTALAAAAPLELRPPLPDLSALVPWAAAPLDKPPVDIRPPALPAPPSELPAAPAAGLELPAAPKPAAPVPASRALPCVGAWTGIASESLECGRARFARGEYEDAGRALESAVKGAVSDRDLAAEARYWLGETLYRLAQFERADWLYRQVAQVQGRAEFGPWALHGSGWTALRLGDWNRARDAFNQLLNIAHPVPLDTWGRHGLGLALYALGRYQDAHKTWSDIRRPPPALERDVQFWIADTLGRIGQAGPAAEGLARFTERGDHPLLGQALVRLGWWNLAASKPAEAADAFRAFLNSPAGRQPTTERDWANAGLAVALLAGADADGAREALRALDARRSPLATAIRLRLALAAVEGGQAAATQALTHELLGATLSPGVRPWVLLVRGEAHRAEGNRDDARTQFELARSVDAGSLTGQHATFRLALTNFEMREFAQTATDLTPLVGAAASPELAQAARLLQGEAAYHAGDYAKAAAAYERVLVETPDAAQAPAVRLALAWTALRQGQRDEARRRFVDFARAHAADPHAVDALLLASELALESGALDPARLLLEQIVTAHAGHPRADFARLNRAILMTRTGQAAAAEPILREWIGRAPFPPLLGRAWVTLGTALLAVGPPGEAAKAFAAARQEADGALAALGLGIAALADSQLDVAAKELETARDTGTAHITATAEYGLATVAFHRGALADFRRGAEAVVANAPKSGLAGGLLYVMAGLDAEAKAWPSALGAAKRLVADFPAHEAADDGLERVGGAAARAGAWPVAHEAYALLRQKYPQSPFVESSQQAWAEALLETGRAAEARQALEQVVSAPAATPAPAALVALGRAREAAGDHAGALDAFSRAAAAGATWSRPASLSHARVLAAERKWDESRRVLEPLLKTSEGADAGEIAVAIGDTYRGEGQALAAAEYYMTAGYVAPESPAGRRALLSAARSFAALKQPAAAATVYRKLLAQSNLPADLAAAARQGLDEIKR